MTDYQFYKRMGVCPMCRKESLFGSECACPECRAKNAEATARKRKRKKENEKIYERQQKKNLSDRRRAEGKCYVCGKDLNGDKHKACIRCRARKNAWQKARNLRIC